MIITCPHCHTKYQVTFEAIGSAGRKVQCAHCNQAWDQRPMQVMANTSSDRLFDAIEEDAMDEAMVSEAASFATESRLAAPPEPQPAPARIDPVELKRRQMAFSRRQNAMISRLPLARLRRAARIAGVAMLVLLVGGSYFGRVMIVERYPEMAGVYEAVGLGVNIVGLDFSNLETMRTSSGGNDVLMVSAQIVGASPKPVRVPPVVVSLLDDQGEAVYEWSVASRAQSLMAGERATFDTRLSLPPSEAERVRLTFASSGGSSGTVSAERREATPSATDSGGSATPARTQDQ